jgi:hypothetical protein
MAFSIGDLFGEDSAVRQILIWQVAAQIIGALMQPGLNEVTQLVYQVAQTVPLSADEAADLVVRGFLTEGDGAGIAARNGVSAGDFHLMVKNHAEAPSPEQLVEALRRKIIPADAGSPDGVGVKQGIAEGHLSDKWADMLIALGEVPIGIADAVDGVVESQISFEQGAQIAYQNGLSQESFQTLINIRGNPPSPTQLGEMVHRGVIPLRGTGPDVTSFQQGIAESAWKNKWEPAFEAIMEVLPAARSVTAMLRDGALTSAQAAAIWKAQGYGPDTVTAFLHEASKAKTSAAHALAKSDILKLYVDRVITHDQALTLLEQHGYEAHDAAYELQVQDLHAAIAAETAAVAKIKTLFIARKISKATASAALDTLQVVHTQRDQLLGTWDLERGLNVKTLTAAEIVDAWNYEVLTTPEALAELQAVGYTAFDAWVLLSVKNKAALSGRPGGQPSPEDRYP